MSGHESTGTAKLMRAGLSESLNLLIGIDLVVLQHSKLDLLVLVLNLLWFGINSLLLLLTTTNHWDSYVEGTFLEEFNYH